MERTGMLYACEHFGLEPDIILTAKSLAAGLPLGALTGKAEIMDLTHVGGVGGTCGGNPLSCKAALAVLETLQEGLLVKAKQCGEEIQNHMVELRERHEIIGDIRGLGPMVGMELVKSRKTKTPATEETKQLVRRCYEKGRIIIPCGK